MNNDLEGEATVDVETVNKVGRLLTQEIEKYAPRSSARLALEDFREVLFAM